MGRPPTSDEEKKEPYIKDSLWKVKKILGRKIINKKLYYKISWHSSYELFSNMRDSEEVVKQFELKRAMKKAKKGKINRL